MAHYARNTPPVRPPGRSMMPDQPWTAWWEIDDPEPAAPDERPTGATTGTTGAPATAPATTIVATAEDASAPEAHDDDTDPFAFAHVEATHGGGLRRIGVEPADNTPVNAPEATASDAEVTAAVPDTAAAPTNWGVLETAASAAAAPVGVQTIYGRFTVEGEARRPGDLVFAGVTFPDPVSAVPVSGAIELSIEHATNVAPDGVVVADMGGFTPDRQGFTLITTAIGPGPVRVDGQYVVEI